jgi:hypothetical protein
VATVVPGGCAAFTLVVDAAFEQLMLTSGIAAAISARRRLAGNDMRKVWISPAMSGMPVFVREGNGRTEVP